MTNIPQEIARKIGHLFLTQVHAALACHYANQPEIGADLESEARGLGLSTTRLSNVRTRGWEFSLLCNLADWLHN